MPVLPATSSTGFFNNLLSPENGRRGLLIHMSQEQFRRADWTAEQGILILSWKNDGPTDPAVWEFATGRLLMKPSWV